MIKRTVEVSTPETFIYLKNKHLVFENEGGEVGRVPCEDLGVLVLGTPRLTVTNAALSAAVDAGTAVLTCGADHHPTGLLLPVAGAALHAKRLREQLDASEPTKKQMWRQVVIAKIENQAAVLTLDRPERARLKTLASEVKSGDPDNREAQAARCYWPALFGDPLFRRSREGPTPNDLLNYGYMVLRAAMARALCGTGLHPALGVHHHHRENAFALADDLMEPYRPFVDARVRDMRRVEHAHTPYADAMSEPQAVARGLPLFESEGGEEENSHARLNASVKKASGLDKWAKGRLLPVLSDPVFLGDEKGPLLVAMQKTAASAAAVFAGEARELKLPAWP